MGKEFGETLSTHVIFRAEPAPGVRYTSGLTIYDEALIDGRFVDRYWVPDGYIKADHDPSPEERVGPSYDFHSFRIEIDGQSLHGYWKWAGAHEEPGTESGSRHSVIELEHTVRPVKVRVHMRLDGTPVMTRWLEITNTSDQPAALGSVSPWSGMLWKIENMSELLPPTQKEAFTLGWYESEAHSNEGTFAWRPLPHGTTRIESARGFSGFRTPFFVVRNECTGDCAIGHIAWSGNWFFEFQCYQDPAIYGTKLMPHSDKSASLSFNMGPAGPHPQRIIAPGETVRTPEIHLGHLKGDLDECVQAMHTHLRRSVIPKSPEGRRCLVQYDHGGAGFAYWVHVWRNKITEAEAQLFKEADIAADLGCELFILDSGWNTHPPKTTTGEIYDTTAMRTSDWTPDATIFPDGLKPLREYLRKKNLLFGMWIEPEVISCQSSIAAEHPDWLMQRDGKMLKGQMDLTKPEVAAWMEAEVCRIIEEYEIDLFRLDYNVMDIGEGGHTQRDGFVESTLWRYYEAFYSIFERIREKYPQVILQHCAAGGGRNDLGMASRWHEEYLTDGHFMPRLLQNINGLTLAFPPEVFVIASPTFFHYTTGARDIDSQLRTYMLMVHPMIGGVAPNLQELTPERRARHKHYVDLYKNFLRPILPTCRVFHHSPITDRKVSDDWIVLEYAAQDASRSVAMVYRLKGAVEDTYHFIPRGLNTGKTYKVTFDNTGTFVTVPGRELEQMGLQIRVAKVFASELLLFEEV